MRSLFAAEAAPEKKADEKERPDDPNKERSVQVYQARTRNFERRIKSEAHLEESLPWHFEKGAAYHCFSFGDVDALTYLRAVVKQQPLEYVALSTWCMAQTDVDEIRKWVERGLIGHVDFYVGEIFQASYAPIFLQLSELVRITPPLWARGHIPQPLKSYYRIRRPLRFCRGYVGKRQHKPALRVRVPDRRHRRGPIL